VTAPAPRRAVLDTSVLLAPDVTPILGELAISSASLAELHFGVLVAKDDQVRAHRLRRLGVIESRFAALPVDAAVAREYGNLAAAVAGTARQPRARVTDLLIAATAAVHHAALYTRNAGDLRGLDHLLEIVPV
jgi:toxin FitB